MTKNFLSASHASLLSCPVCHLLSKPGQHIVEKGKEYCPRCGERLYIRKPESLSRTWALVLAAIIFYIPANVLPIMKVTSMGNAESDTILSGVIYFIQTGMWPIALVIFIASVFVPILKLLILIFLLITVQTRSKWRPRDRTRLYRMIEAIGRWSMVDIFVVTLMVALVKLGALADIEAAQGAVFFAAVVVVTMFAAMSFDPRLIWDVLEKPQDP
ncbi:MAG: paraquat-inducible protein A [Desulfobacterales bacterium]|jgi:paraquat-inducible protein A|nr:paraquat-inducible protein A [Desulfobacterales bacterium]